MKRVADPRYENAAMTNLGSTFMLGSLQVPATTCTGARTSATSGPAKINDAVSEFLAGEWLSVRTLSLSTPGRA